MKLKPRQLFLVSIATSVLVTLIAMSNLVPLKYFPLATLVYLALGMFSLLVMWKETLRIGAAEDYIRTVIKSFILIVTLGINAVIIGVLNGGLY